MLTDENNDDFEFLSDINKVMSDIYKDKKYYCLSYREISELRCISVSDAREMFNKAKKLLKNKNSAWMDGLSPRAINTLKHKYKNYAQLANDVTMNDIDLELLDGVGHKVAVEIRRWIMTHA